jgi:hypothetical protein
MSPVHHPLDEESELDMTILTVILFFSIMLSPLLPALVLGGVEVGERIYNLIRRPNPDGVWAQVGQIGRRGAVLIRPDNHVGWRSTAAVDQPEHTLTHAIEAILGRR